MVADTTFECLGCGRCVNGKTDGSFSEPSWGRMQRIDGPDAICPQCIKEDLSRILAWLAEDGFEHAFVSQDIDERIRL